MEQVLETGNNSNNATRKLMGSIVDLHQEDQLGDDHGSPRKVNRCWMSGVSVMDRDHIGAMEVQFISVYLFIVNAFDFLYVCSLKGIYSLPCFSLYINWICPYIKMNYWLFSLLFSVCLSILTIQGIFFTYLKIVTVIKGV